MEEIEDKDSFDDSIMLKLDDDEEKTIGREIIDLADQFRADCKPWYDQWEKDGRLSLLDRARKKLQNILDNHRPTPVAEEQLQAMRNRVAHFKA